MAIYERTQRESAHVFSRVVDKSKVPSALSWAALGCVTASKGELNHVYQVGTTDLLASYFGEPSADHISLVCSDKIISEDNTMFLIRVAHENSLRGAQVVVSTEDVWGNKSGQKKGIGVVSGSIVVGNDSPAEGVLLIQLMDEDNNEKVRNIADDLSMDIVDDPLLMENTSVLASYRDVYQIDDKGNKSFSNELCLLLSDVADEVRTVVRSGGNEPLTATQYEDNWYYSDGYALRTVIVLKPSAGLVENTPCDVIFAMKQVAKRAYGTSSPNKVTMPIALKTASGGSPVNPDEPDNPDEPTDDAMTFTTQSFPVTDLG